jgi:hypothetical protein
MTSETIDLPDDVMAQAAQDFFAAEWASAWEEAGFSFAAGTEITEVCPTQDADKLLELIRPYAARLVHAWGRGVGEMFHLMDIPEHEWAEALYYILMSCRGHGVGLEDDHGDHIDIAESRQGKAIDPSPFNSEFSEFSDLAYEVVEAEARRPDDDPDPDGAFLPGDRVHVEARMPSGDRLTGTGIVIRCGSPGEVNNAGEGVIIALDESEGVEPCSYSGRAVLVDADECEGVE